MTKYKIVIDPGHGGSDRYNIGASRKYVEADGNLAFSLYLKAYLKNDFDVVLTRETDKTLSLPARGKMAKGADMFLSVHSDAGSITAGGVTVFDSVDLKNETLAKAIGQAVAAAMGISFRGTKERESTNYPGEDYYTVIDTAQDIGCPVVLLIERGFHSNPKEEKLLLDDDIVKKSAAAAAEVIKEYFKIEEDDEDMKTSDFKVILPDGKSLKVEGYLTDKTSYLPMRGILEDLGYKVGWKSGEITISK